MGIRPEIYFSFDVEADGDIPGDHSMLALGISVCAHYDGRHFIRFDLDNPENEFLIGIKPISGYFIKEAEAICQEGGFGRAEMLVSGYDARVAMQKVAEWIQTRARGYKPIAVAYPLGFDWKWLDYYFLKFYGSNPFGFSGAIDIKSQFVGKRNSMVGNSTKRNMPNHVLSKRKHTHNPLDDAKEQGDLFCNIWENL